MIIYIDSREQTPFSFDDCIFCTGIEIKKLDTGDYSLKGFEKTLMIERKKTVAELSQNITEKRFIRELERARNYQYKFVLCEFDYDDVLFFPNNQLIPHHIKAKIKISPNFIIKKIDEFTIEYGINFILAGSTALANRICVNLMKNVYATRNP